MDDQEGNRRADFNNMDKAGIQIGVTDKVVINNGSRIVFLTLAAFLVLGVLSVVIWRMHVSAGGGNAPDSATRGAPSASRSTAGVHSSAAQKSSSASPSPSPSPALHASSIDSLPGSLKIYAGEQLMSGQSWRTSKVTMTMQPDGQLEIYGRGSVAEWSSDTVGTGIRAIMQADGNFVIYNKKVFGIWSSGTEGQGAYLEMESSGAVAIINKGHVLDTFPGTSSTGSLPSSLKIYADEQLMSGQSWRTSKVTMTMQPDGQLEIYGRDGVAEWSSDTVGTGIKAIMQADGNFVIYNKKVFGIWSSGTEGQGAYLEMESSGAVAIIYNGHVLFTFPGT